MNRKLGLDYMTVPARDDMSGWMDLLFLSPNGYRENLMAGHQRIASYSQRELFCLAGLIGPARKRRLLSVRCPYQVIPITN